MNYLAIVAIVAMYLIAHMHGQEWPERTNGSHAEEVILWISPPPWGETKIVVTLGLSLPDRNPKRP